MTTANNVDGHPVAMWTHAQSSYTGARCYLDMQEALFAAGVVAALAEACSSACAQLRIRAVTALGNAALDAGEANNRAISFLEAVPFQLLVELCNDAGPDVRVR